MRTYLERDLPQFGFRIPAERLRRLWTILAHNQGQLLNTSALATSLDLDGKTIKYYIDILSDLLLVYYLKPWYFNTKKRLIKSPRIYIRDSGLLHGLLGIANYDQLFSHPIVGASFEGMVIENILSILSNAAEMFFYRTSNGQEIDLLLKLSSNKLWAIEIKKELSLKVSKGFHNCCKDLGVNKKYIVYSEEEEFQINNDTTVLGLYSMMKKLL